MVFNQSTLDLKIKSEEITLKTLGFDDFEVYKSTAFPFLGGEKQGLQRLHSYFSETKNVSKYKETRNGLIDDDYSSKFSAWLANGSLSAVSIFQEVIKYEAEFGSNESTYWLIFEMIWRNFLNILPCNLGIKYFTKMEF